MTRQPVSVLYGGAHLFKPNAAERLGRIALATFDAVADTSDPLHARVRRKIQSEAVEDLRIDFEDGYGVRSDEEEDGHARTAGAALASAGTPFIGVRVNTRRAERTLDTFFAAAGGSLPHHFVVTLPKVNSPAQVSALVHTLEKLEARYALPALGIELMAETPEAVVSTRELVLAGGTRVQSVHFGAYDYLSALDVAADAQHLLHPFCDDARIRLKLTGVRVVDGATSVLPLGDNVRSALALHEKHIRHALSFGIYQGWDLHPAQLVARHFAVQRFFAENEAKTRLRFERFLDEAARARVSGSIFDDAATARGLANFFLRGHAAGAIEQLPVPLPTLQRYALGDFSG